MKKIFTLLFVAVIMSMSVVSVQAAQTARLTKQQESALQEALPYILSPLKEQLGIDLFSAPALDAQVISRCQLMKSVKMKKAEGEEPPMVDVNLIPDSTELLYIEASDDAGNVIGMVPMITLVYENTVPVTLPVNPFNINLNIPSALTVKMMGSPWMKIMFDVATNGDEGAAADAPLLKLTVSYSIVGMDDFKSELLNLTIAQDDNSAFVFNVDINQQDEGGIVGLLVAMVPALENDYGVTLDIFSALFGGPVVANSYAVISDGTKVNTGDAYIGLDLMGLLGGSEEFPLYYATLVGYTEGVSSTYNKYWFSMNAGDTQNEITMKEYSLSSNPVVASVPVDSVHTADYFLTMSVPGIAEAIVPANAVRMMIQQFAAKEDTQFSLKTEILPDGATERIQTSQIDITTEVAETAMVGRVYVKTYESNALATDMLIEANLPMTGEKQLTLDILNSGNLFARTYITSNLAEIIAGVDNVTKGEEMKIINTGEGITLRNAGNGTYTVVALNGAVVGKGMISPVIPTANLEKGVYILVVNSENGSKSFKFIR